MGEVVAQPPACSRAPLIGPEVLFVHHAQHLRCLDAQRLVRRAGCPGRPSTSWREHASANRSHSSRVGAPRRGAVTMWTRSGRQVRRPSAPRPRPGPWCASPTPPAGPFDAGGGCHWSAARSRANLSRSCQAEGTAWPRSREVITTCTSSPARLAIALRACLRRGRRQQLVADDRGVAAEVADLLDDPVPGAGGTGGQLVEPRVLAHHEPGVHQLDRGCCPATSTPWSASSRPGCGAAPAAGRWCRTWGCRRGGRRARSCGAPAEAWGAHAHSATTCQDGRCWPPSGAGRFTRSARTTRRAAPLQPTTYVVEVDLEAQRVEPLRVVRIGIVLVGELQVGPAAVPQTGRDEPPERLAARADGSTRARTARGPPAAAAAGAAGARRASWCRAGRRGC